MNDREQRLRELLDRRASQFPTPSTVPSGLIRRARRSMLIVALAVVVGVSAVGYGAVAGVRALRGSSVPGIRPSASPASTSPAPSPAPSSSPVDIPGANLALPLDGSVDQLAVGVGALYASYSPAGDFNHDVIARFDLQTHAVVRSAPLVSAIRMAVTPGVLWVIHWDSTSRKSLMLSGLDARTLAVVNPGSGIPASPSQLVSTPHGLWVSSGVNLNLLSLSDGRHLSAAHIDGIVTAMGTDPAGQRLYVATADPAGSGPRSIYEIDARTGATLKRVPGPIGIIVAGVSATADGVWVAVSTGLLGTVVFYRASDLKQTATYHDPQRGGPATNGINAGVARGILWVTDGMVGVVACADPVTGHIRENVIPQAAGVNGFSNVVGVGSEVYIGIAGGVLSITPDARCTG